MCVVLACLVPQSNEYTHLEQVCRLEGPVVGPAATMLPDCTLMLEGNLRRCVLAYDLPRSVYLVAAFERRCGAPAERE